MSDHRDQLLEAHEIINRNAYLTASQRQTVTGALEAALTATYPTAAELTSDPRAGHAEFAAEVGRLRDQAHAAQVAELTAQRDQAREDYRRAEARAERYRRDTIDAEQRLRHIDRILNTPPPVPTGDAWHAYDHERDQLAEQLAATPSRVGHSPSAHMLGQCACQRAAVGPA